MAALLCLSAVGVAEAVDTDKPAISFFEKGLLGDIDKVDKLFWSPGKTFYWEIKLPPSTETLKARYELHSKGSPAKPLQESAFTFEPHSNELTLSGSYLIDEKSVRGAYTLKLISGDEVITEATLDLIAPSDEKTVSIMVTAPSPLKVGETFMIEVVFMGDIASLKLVKSAYFYSMGTRQDMKSQFEDGNRVYQLKTVYKLKAKQAGTIRIDGDIFESVPKETFMNIDTVTIVQAL